ncbi:hypothetical protein ACS0TY_005658 [Phlomoides rotata]
MENKDGILKSKMIYKLSSIDERFKKLSFLTWNPPILPPCTAIFKGIFYEVLFPAKWTPCLFNNNVKLLPCLLYLAKMLQLQTGHVATATADFLYLIFYFLSNF